MNDAIAAYNTLQSKLRFNRVSTPESADIEITHWGLPVGYSTDVYYYTNVNYPYSDGSPGRYINIGGYTILNFNNINQYILMLVHLLGHSVGIMHSDLTPNAQGKVTDYSSAENNHNNIIGAQIPNTPYGYNSDPGSCMRSNYFGSSWAGFSNYDIIAITNLYPDFTWNSSSTAGTNAYSNSSIAIDQYDKIYYIRTDGIIAAAKGSGNAWFPDFPRAKTGSDLYWNSNNDELFYIATNNTICRIYWNGSSWNYQYTAGTTSSSNSGITMDQYNRVYYIRTDGIIAITYRDGSTWSNAWFPDFPKATTGSDLYWNSNNNELFYTATNNMICRIYWNGSSWNYQYTAGTTSSSNSGITMDQLGKIYYIRTDGIIAATYRDGSNWGNMWFPDYPNAKTSSTLQWISSNNEMYYISMDNDIIRLFWDGNNYSYTLLSRRTNETASMKLLYDDNHLYYINSSTIHDMAINR